MLAASFVISEFVADNHNELIDRYGNSSDWIEIHNQGNTAGSLNGYYLTDNATNKTKWQFPDVTVAADGYLVVFASNQDDRDPTQELHTNFALSKDGEYLGLIAPDGTPVVSEYSPTFPPQLENVSYGIGNVLEPTTLVAAGANASWLVPTNSSLGQSWTQPGFNAAAWTSTKQIPNSRIVISEANTNSTAVVEIQNVSGLSQVTAGWRVAVGDSDTDINSVNATRWSLPNNIAAGSVQYKTDGTTNAWGSEYRLVEHDQGLGHAGRPGRPCGRFRRLGLDGRPNRHAECQFRRAGRHHGAHERLVGRWPVPGRQYDHELLSANRQRRHQHRRQLCAALHPTSNGTKNTAISTTFGSVSAPATTGVGFERDTGYENLLGTTGVDTAMFGVNSSIYVRLPFTVPAGQTFAIAQAAHEVRRRICGLLEWHGSGAQPCRRNSRHAIGLQCRRHRPSRFPSNRVRGFRHFQVQKLAGRGKQCAGDSRAERVVDQQRCVDFARVRRVADPFAVDRLYDHSHARHGERHGDAGFRGRAGNQRRARIFHFRVPNHDQRRGPRRHDSLHHQRRHADGHHRHGVCRADHDQRHNHVARGCVQDRLYDQRDRDRHLYLLERRVDAIDLDAAGFRRHRHEWPNAELWHGPRHRQQLRLGSANVGVAQSIPSISIVTDSANLWDPTTGIYVNATQDGQDWERPASVELINPDGTTGFQINAGLRIRGGYSRNDFNPKHAFRLFFNDDYDGSLDYPLFGDEGVDSFKKVDLRTAQNYSWSSEGDSRMTFLRDIFSRDTMRDLGEPYTRGRDYFLYLNGQFWGIYQTEERPDADYAASYFGGDGRRLRRCEAQLRQRLVHRHRHRWQSRRLRAIVGSFQSSGRGSNASAEVRHFHANAGAQSRWHAQFGVSGAVRCQKT